MNSTQPMTTVRIPSGFAMPTCGHAPASALGTVWTLGCDRGTTLPTGGVVSTVVRERQAAVVTDGRAFAKAYIPGTSAWRPPTC